MQALIEEEIKWSELHLARAKERKLERKLKAKPEAPGVEEVPKAPNTPQQGSTQTAM